MWWLILIIIFLIFLIIFISFLVIKKRKQKKFLIQNAKNFKLVKKNYRLLSDKKNTYSFNQVEKLSINKQRNSGIYAMYFPNQKINEIVPVYIGQAKDIRKRWKQHILEIKKIRTGESTSRKYSKIMHYAQQRKLTEKNLNFVILRKTNESKLDLIELKYINDFKADIYGFNAKGGNIKKN